MDHVNPDGRDLSGGACPIALLHVYGQHNWHDEAYVVGNRAGLEKLRAAIDAALAGAGERGQGATDDVSVADGEGFTAIVLRNDADWRAESWDRLVTPYTAEECQHQPEGAVGPWDMAEFKPPSGRKS